MTTERTSTFYVCPQCHGALQDDPGTLRCLPCERTFPKRDDIPDFLLEAPGDSADPFLRDVEDFGKLAAIYESPLWFPVMLRLLGGWNASSLSELVAFGRGLMDRVQGRVLDVATGTGTYGRHVAGRGRVVFGIDVSQHMLRKGQVFAQQEKVTHMHFARADAGALPFADGTFDGCMLCGSLHIFPDKARTPCRSGTHAQTRFTGVGDDRRDRRFGGSRRRGDPALARKQREIQAIRSASPDAAALRGGPDADRDRDPEGLGFGDGNASMSAFSG